MNLEDLIQRVSSAFLARVSGAASMLLFHVIVARMFGAAVVGRVMVAIALITVVSLVVRFGSDNVILRAFSEEPFDRRVSRLKGWSRRLLLGTALAGLLVTLILGITRQAIASSWFGDPELAPILLIVSASLVPLTISVLLGQFLKAADRATQGILAAHSIGPLCAALTVYPLGLLFGELAPALSYALGSFTTAVVAAIWWKWASKSAGTSDRPASVSNLYGTAAPMLLYTGGQTIIRQIPIVVLGIVTDAATAGLFGVAFRATLLVSYIFVSVNSIVAPRFAEIAEQGKTLELRAVANRTALIMLLFSSPVLLVLVAAPSIVLSLFSDAFLRATPILVILSVGQFVAAATGPTQFLLMMSRHERSLALLTLIEVLVAVPWFLLTSTLGGATHLAIAVSSTIALENIALLAIVRRRLGFWVLPTMASWSQDTSKRERLGHIRR